MIFFPKKSRPYHFGPYPLERIARDGRILELASAKPASQRAPVREKESQGFARSIENYHQIFHNLRDDERAAAKAPVPDDLHRRMVDIKGSAYFINASQVAICSLTESCWLYDVTPLQHSHAIVALVSYPRVPENGTLAYSWVADTVTEVTAPADRG